MGSGSRPSFSIATRLNGIWLFKKEAMTALLAGASDSLTTFPSATWLRASTSAGLSALRWLWPRWTDASCAFRSEQGLINGLVATLCVSASMHARMCTHRSVGDHEEVSRFGQDEAANNVCEPLRRDDLSGARAPELSQAVCLFVYDSA